MDVNLSELRELVIDREAWHAVTHGVAKSQTQLSNWTELNWTEAGNGKVKIDLLGISELKWTGMGKFNSDDQCLYYCGQESHRRNGVTLLINKSPKCSTWVQPQKCQNDLGSFPRQAIQHHSNPNLCPYHQSWRSWRWSVLWRPTRPLRTNTKKTTSFSS